MMMASKLLASLFVAQALCFNMEVSMTSSLTFDEAAAKNRPVSKVITLLKDMLKQLEKEAEEDEDFHETCQSNAQNFLPIFTTTH